MSTKYYIFNIAESQTNALQITDLAMNKCILLWKENSTNITLDKVKKMIRSKTYNGPNGDKDIADGKC